MTDTTLIKNELGYEYKGVLIARRRRGWRVTKSELTGSSQYAGNPWFGFGTLKDAIDFIERLGKN